MLLDQKTFHHYRHQFSLGHLTTESFHSLSKNLSTLANVDLNEALKVLKTIDTLALEQFKNYQSEIFALNQTCQQVMKSGGRIFIAGCGATGRLAIGIEKLFIDKYKTDNVIGFMAGGDFALIKSVESFEDNFDYAHRQLKDLGFNENDLLLGVTEGGETSFVIGATELAQKISKHKPYFLYCNPDEQLVKVERSKRVIENTEIHKLNLTIGPMAISGSTRMQASTVLMFACGLATLYDFKTFDEFKIEMSKILDDLEKLNYNFLAPFIENEASWYKNAGIIQYVTDPSLAICVLTDTTERSPTFNLKAFEMTDDKDFGLCYLSLKNETDDQKAWFSLLSRNPRDLNWAELAGKVNLEKIYKFDISENSFKRRKELNNKIQIFEILNHSKSVHFKLAHESYQLAFDNNQLFIRHLTLKLLLNALSTLIMGRLGRYDGNVMTFVRASNMKLIDRALRYSNELLKRKNINVSEDEIIAEIFKNNFLSEKPIVQRVVESLSKKV